MTDERRDYGPGPELPDDGLRTTRPDHRAEVDPLGVVHVSADSLFGAQTQRAVDNFAISGTSIARMPLLIRALALVKKAAALANVEAGELASDVAGPVIRACDEAAGGELDHAFVVDVFQGGAGTSTNMNMNEVLANRALEIMGHGRGRYDVVSPNDHVNRSQSTNDAYATAVRLTVLLLNRHLVRALENLADAVEGKASELADVAKLGRTQLQDAVPMTLGQEFGAFATTLREDAARASEMGRLFLEVNLGGTAIGTGVGASAKYCDVVVEKLRETTGLPVTRADNLIEATWDMGAFVLYSGLLKRVASKLSKMCNDLRLLSSGPRGGFGEIRLPERQPGSSLMPGKVNPVIPEAVNQIAFRVFGADTAITFAAEAGQLQLNAFEPVIIWSIYEAVELLVAGLDLLTDKCVVGIEADAANCAENLARSTALATALVPLLGYARAAEVAKLALARGMSIESALKEIESKQDHATAAVA